MTPDKETIIHTHKVLTGFNTFIEKGLVRIEDTTMHVFKDLIGDTEAKQTAFIKNAYMYLRTKIKRKQNITVWLVDIESGEALGCYEKGKVKIGKV